MPKKSKAGSVPPLRVIGDRTPTPEAVPAEPDPPATEDVKTVLHKPGLRWCFDKGAITRVQFDAGERYGRDHRDAEMLSAAVLKSSLAGMMTAGCGGGAGTPSAPGEIDLLMQMQIAHAMKERDAVWVFFDFDAGALAVLSAICGRQMTPLEAARGDEVSTNTLVRDRAKELTAVLRSVLTMLAIFYRKRDADLGVKTAAA